ncbi:MAG: hypothetical protein N2654_02615 [Deltaproteobacteria bacterium]|nr:hypothetical protein [Deltaproteobacteria bacterium]
MRFVILSVIFLASFVTIFYLFSLTQSSDVTENTKSTSAFEIHKTQPSPQIQLTPAQNYAREIQSKPETIEELEELGRNFTEFTSEDGTTFTQEQSNKIPRQINDLTEREKKKFFGEIVKSMKTQFSDKDIAIVLVEIKSVMEQFQDKREYLKQVLAEVLRMHKTGDKDFFETAMRYRSERLEYYKSFSIELQKALALRNMSEEVIKNVTGVIEKALENQRVIF